MIRTVKGVFNRVEPVALTRVLLVHLSAIAQINLLPLPATQVKLQGLVRARIILVLLLLIHQEYPGKSSHLRTEMDQLPFYLIRDRQQTIFNLRYEL